MGQEPGILGAGVQDPFLKSTIWGSQCPQRSLHFSKPQSSCQEWPPEGAPGEKLGRSPKGPKEVSAKEPKGAAGLLGSVCNAKMNRFDTALIAMAQG